MEKAKLINSVEKYMRKGNVPAAIEQYLEYLKQKPTDITTLNALGDLYIRAGKTEEAIRRFSSIADIHTDNGFPHLAIVMLKKALKHSPNNTELKKKIAYLYTTQGKLTEANHIYIEVAQFFEKIGNQHEALDFYEKAASCDATNPSIHLTIGQIYISKGMLDVALHALLKAGSIFTKWGETEQAHNVYSKILYIAPENLTALEALIDIYTLQNQPDKATYWLQKGLEKNRDNIELILLAGHYYLSTGRVDDAEKLLLTIPEKRQERFEFGLEISEQLLRNGEINRAVECLNQGLESVNRKSCLESAANFYQRILEIEKAHLSALKGAAKTYRTLGDDENLLTTLNLLFEMAEEREDDAESAQTMEEISSLLLKKSASDENAQKAQRHKQIEIDFNDTLNCPTSIPERSAINLSSVSPDYIYSNSGEVINLSFGNDMQTAAPGISAMAYFGQCLLPEDRTLLAQDKISSFSPVELHNILGSMIDSLNELINNSHFSREEERELLTQKNYFRMMQSFSNLLIQSLSLDMNASHSHLSSASLTSQISPEIFKMLELSSGQMVTEANDYLKNLDHNLLPGYQSQTERRRANRSNLKLPLQVYFRDGRQPEDAETVNISKLGIRFKLKNRVTIGTPLRLEMTMPKEFHLYERDTDFYATEAIICQITAGIGNEIFVGAEFGSLL